MAEQNNSSCNETAEVNLNFDFPFNDCDFLTTSLNLASSAPATVENVLDHLQTYAPSGLTPKFLDMGCGDGRLVFSAAKRGWLAAGIDLEPSNIEVCRQAAKENGLADKTQFFLADMFTFDLSEYNLISCYIYEKTLQQISNKLGDRLKQGNCVVATMLYKPRKWIPKFVDDVYKIYIYDDTSVITT